MSFKLPRPPTAVMSNRALVERDLGAELDSRVSNEEELGAPNLELSRQRLHDLLEKDPKTGALLALDMPLHKFEDIGTGVAAFMYIVVAWRDLFWFL